ncbi:MAG: hypothetical protein EHM58_10010 [Ignavibacteriae bacterium]|nr:MAG: hypothetical protein EHM58_10010 [Ignavibacteriota bacterium]
MKKTNLIKILKTFSKEEMKMFGKFISSPYHNNGKNCSPLFKQLQKFHPDFVSDKLSKENIYKKLYPGKKYNKQVLWNLTSAAEKLTKEFLTQIALRKNKITKTGLILSELGNRKLLNDYPKTLNEMEKILEKSGIDYDYFENKGHLENYRQEYFHLIDKIKPMSDSKLKASEYQILLFLRMTVGGLNDMNLLSESYNYKFDVNIPLEFAKNLDLKCIVEYAHNNKFEYTFLIEIYYHTLMLLLEPKQTVHLDKLRELYGLHYNKFTKSEKRNMMHWIANYCVDKAEFDDLKYKRITFELNEFRLKEGLAFYPENQIPKAIYIQILNAALAVNETEWAVNFIKNYTTKLQPLIRDSMECMAYAFLYFHTKEYRKVLNYLNKVELSDIQDKFFARTLTARSYYELHETEPLLSYIDSSRQFLMKNPLVTNLSRVYIQNFLKYIKKIVFIRENKTYDKIYILRSEIEKNNIISNKKWLLEKLGELEK